MTGDVSEKPGHLWLLAASPALWAVHFLLCYGIASVWCARAGHQSPLGPVRIAIFVLTALALAAVAGIGWGGYRRHRLHGAGNEAAVRVSKGDT